jgi:hypothetical protein
MFVLQQTATATKKISSGTGEKKRRRSSGIWNAPTRY